jgi:hypothetical protein
MAIRIEQKRAGSGRGGKPKRGNPHMEGMAWGGGARGKWDPKTKSYRPITLGAEKVIKDKKKPYRKPKKPTGVKRGTGPRGMKGRKKK